jgi:hypothetical protein
MCQYERRLLSDILLCFHSLNLTPKLSNVLFMISHDFWHTAYCVFSTVMDVQILGAYEKSICTNWLYIVENLFCYMNCSIVHMHVKDNWRFFVFFPNPTFQGTQPFRSETAKLLAYWVYTGITFATINMQTGDD